MMVHGCLFDAKLLVSCFKTYGSRGQQSLGLAGSSGKPASLVVDQLVAPSWFYSHGNLLGIITIQAATSTNRLVNYRETMGFIGIFYG